MAMLAGAPMLPLKLDWYVTVLDLGPWGALYTAGWDRRVLSTGGDAKQVKQEINCRRIYPPRSFASADTLAAAAPVVQSPPPQVREGSKSATCLTRIHCPEHRPDWNPEGAGRTAPRGM
jgi:hypothetical protein